MSWEYILHIKINYGTFFILFRVKEGRNFFVYLFTFHNIEISHGFIFSFIMHSDKLQAKSWT